MAGLVPALLSTASFPSRANAHASPHGLQLVWPSSTSSALPYILANRGLLPPNVGNQDGPDSVYSLRCNEGYGVNTSAFPSGLFDAQGGFVLQTTNSISVTTDRGCVWSDGTGLPDLTLGGFTQNKSAPNKLLVTTQTYEPAQQPSQIFQSDDYGRTWTVLSSNNLETVYTQLISSTDGQRLVAAGGRYDLDKKKLFSVMGVSADGGKTWADVDLESARFPLGFHPSNANIVFAREPDAMLQVDPQDTLLRSEDGGKTFTVISKIAPITAFTATPDGSTMWIGSSTGGLFKSTDLGKTFTQEDPDEVSGITCLDYHNEQLWVCANFAPNTNGVWYSADKGESYTLVVDFTEVTTEVLCQAPQVAICGQPWLDWQYEQSTGFTMDAGAPDGGPSGDAGLASDAAVSDGDGSSTSGDAGHARDAAVVRDAGTTEPTSKHDGGGCSATPGATADSWTLAALLASLALVLTRKKR